MSMAKRGTRAASLAGALAVSAALVAASPAPIAGATTNAMYNQTNLVSDIPGVAPVTDPNLVNPWGMSNPPGGPLWVSDNNANVAALYTGALGTPPTPLKPAPGPEPLTVTVAGGAPTGQVFNGTSNFVVHNRMISGPSRFIFASENGDITGWAPNVPPLAPPPFALSTRARVGVSVPQAVYKGLAISPDPVNTLLFAANFHSGKVDVFDKTFDQVNTPSFVDNKIPDGYAPFNVAVFGNNLYVTYAKQNAKRHDDVKGAGHGFIDVFPVTGGPARRLVSRGVLNSPWGMAMAPAGFGGFSGDLLVGNFGDGTIHAFDPTTGALVGTMSHPDGTAIAINGLWGLIFGDASFGSPTTLFFSAGIGDEAHGLLGEFTPVPAV